MFPLSWRLSSTIHSVNPYLFSALEQTPELTTALFGRIPAESWDRPTHQDRFTPREVVAHLADWEPILLDRVRLCVESPGATIIPYDEVQMALEHDYASKDPQAEMERFVKARAETILYLKSLRGSDWALSGQHPERGILSVSDLANMLVCHDVYHLHQLSGAAPTP